jgi:hypothetical protein
MQKTNKLPKDLTDDQVTELALKLRNDFNTHLMYRDKPNQDGFTFGERQSFIQQIKTFYQAIRETI